MVLGRLAMRSLIFSFDSKTEDRERISSALVEQVIILGSSYNIQISFEMEGLFGIKVPVGCEFVSVTRKGI